MGCYPCQDSQAPHRQIDTHGKPTAVNHLGRARSFLYRFVKLSSL
jgi:hypothetical protein